MDGKVVDTVTKAADSASTTTQHGGIVTMLIYCVIIFVIIYFFMVRPNKKRMTEYKKMLDSLKVGNRVMAAGIYGTIKEIKEKSLMLEISKGVVIEVNKNSVSSVE